MAKRHYIPITADVPGAASQGNCALIRKVIRTALSFIREKSPERRTRTRERAWSLWETW